MGLLLSILISCVGVAELLAFYANVRRHIEPHHQQESLRDVAQNYYKDLEAEKTRITKEISKLERNYTLEDYTEYSIDAPTTAINATEIEDEPYVFTNEYAEGEKYKNLLRPNFDQQFWAIKKSRSKENISSKQGYSLERRRSKSESDLNVCRELVLRPQNEIVVSNFWKSPFQTLLEYEANECDDEDDSFNERTLSCSSVDSKVKNEIKPDLQVLDCVDGIKNKKISSSDESLHQFKLKRKLKSTINKDEGGAAGEGVSSGSSSKDKEPFWVNSQ